MQHLTSVAWRSAALVATAALTVVAACSSSPASGPPGSLRGADGGTAAESGPAGARLRCTAGVPKAFGPAPAAWKLPAARCQTEFDALASSSTKLTWRVLSLATVEAPPLVVAKDACDDAVGVTHWDVYAVTGEGYAVSPRSFSLPAPRCQTSFDAFGKQTEKLHYVVLDLDADGRLDLVVTKDACDPQVGVTRWDLYVGAEEGFARAPSAWTLPAARCKDPFDSIAHAGAVRYSLLDLDGDDRRSLVVTKDACDAEIGTKRWDVYRTAGKGFAATPAPFALPAARCTVPFDAVAGTSEVVFGLLDLTADRKPDLVVTKDACGPELGVKRWDVYPNRGEGFDPKPLSYGLPAARCKAAFDGFAGSGAVTYALLDLSCDQRPELVVSHDECDAEIGASHWDLYQGGGGGFVLAPSALALPAGRCQSRWDALSSQATVHHAVASLDTRDAALLVTKDGCDDAAGASRWDRYPAVK